MMGGMALGRRFLLLLAVGPVELDQVSAIAERDVEVRDARVLHGLVDDVILGWQGVQVRVRDERACLVLVLVAEQGLVEVDGRPCVHVIVTGERGNDASPVGK